MSDSIKAKTLEKLIHKSNALDQKSERLARQARNRAERAAKRAARQGDRLKSGAAESRVFNILLVAQNGRLAREALLFAASLRRNAPGSAGRLILAEPLPEAAWEGVETAIPPQIRADLLALGAEIRPFVARHFGRAYPYGNKIEALAVLPEGEPFVFFDSDTLVLGDLGRLPLDFSRPSASMRRSGTWPLPPPYGPGYAGIWGALYRRFGLDFESSLDPAQCDEHWERYLYFNAGWFFGADPAEFGRRFLDWALAVRADPGDELACQSLDPWLDQIVLPLVIHSLGGGRPGPELCGLDGATTCHYRNLSLLYAREPEPALHLMETLLAQPSIARHFAEDPAYRKLVLEGEGRRTARQLQNPAHQVAEQALRHRLKRQGLWFR
ncbi:MAG: hypothetical protein QM682_10165 [Paracoccus sp. (in: a-proteobacteria)]|uniref:hypothetical protein n=1 Tax=Paracoccus sp. TaxID=267 RepID=UPI0039E236FB